MRAHQHAVRLEHVADRRPFGQKFRVRDHVEAVLGAGGIEDRVHRLRGADRQSALLDHDLRAARALQDLSGRPLPILQIGRFARPLPEVLGGRVDADEDDVRLGDVRADLGGEEQVAVAHPADHLVQARLVDGQVVRPPRGDAVRIDVNDHDPVLRAFLGDDRHRRPADVSRTDAKDVRHGNKELEVRS